MSSLRHVVFRVASERYALPLEAVREVVLPQPLQVGGGHVVLLERGQRALGLMVGGVIGVEPLEPGEGGGGLVQGVAAASMGAVTVLEPDALSEAAALLFGTK